jgi:hypothetical protein
MASLHMQLAVVGNKSDELAAAGDGNRQHKLGRKGCMRLAS